MRTPFRWRPGRLAQSTAAASLWQGLRLLFLVVTLIAFARVFSVEQYGALAGVGAWFGILAQVVGLGAGAVLMREVARSKNGLDGALLKAVQQRYSLTAALLLLIVVPISLSIFSGQISALTLLVLAVSELWLIPLLWLHVFWLQGSERVSLASLVQTLPTFVRLLAVGIVLLIGQAELLVYALINLVLMLACVLLVLRASPASGAPVPLLPWREGLPYAYNAGISVFSTESDKTILLSSLGASVAGAYSAASRVAQAAMTPVNALVMSSTARLFRAGEQGQTPSVTHIHASFALLYGAMAAVAIWYAAPCLPWLLGSDFSEAVPMLRALTPWIVISGVRQVLVLALTTSNAQSRRNRIETVAALGGAALNIGLLPVYGWIVSAASLCLMEAFVIAAVIRVLYRRRNA